MFYKFAGWCSQLAIDMNFHFNLAETANPSKDLMMNTSVDISWCACGAYQTNQMMTVMRLHLQYRSSSLSFATD